MLTTPIDYATSAFMALAMTLHVIRIKGVLTQPFSLSAISAAAWIITSFSVVAAMIDQGAHHPEALNTAALLCGAGSAAMALLYGLDAAVRDIVTSAVHTDPPAAHHP